MEAWKGMLWVTFVRVSFAVFAAVANVPLQSSTGILVLVLLVVFAGISYVGARKGYQVGREMGERKREEKES